LPNDRRTSASNGGTRFTDFAAASDAMRAIHETVLRVATTASSVLIRGELGVGKERLARAIHSASDRAGAPFIVVDCSAIPADQTGIELLGHGPRASPLVLPVEEQLAGLLHAARGGTLYFDDIAELPTSAQAALFLALQNSPEASGATDPSLHQGARLICSTTCDLEAEAAARRFRGDLYYLLSVIALRLPPLSERLGDLPGIVHGILQRQPHGPSRRLNQDAITFLRSQAWPGNVRELENVLERSLALDEGEVLGPAQIVMMHSNGADSTSCLREVGQLLERAAEHDLPLHSIKDLYIEQVLKRTDGNKARAARILGVNRTTLYRRGN
jgi:two-component system response regulator PilR (NtrC family)